METTDSSTDRRGFLGLFGALCFAGCNTVSRTTPQPDETEAQTGASTGEGSTAAPSREPPRSGDQVWPMQGYDEGNTGYVSEAAGPGRSATEVWHSRLVENSLDIYSTPVVSEDVIYVGCGTTMQAVDLRDGSTRWNRETNYSLSFRSPTISDDLVVFTGSVSRVLQDQEEDRPDESARIWAVNAGDGSVRWTKPTGYPSTPVATGDTVYWQSITDGRITVHAADAADGTERWTYELDCGSVSETIRPRPVLGDDRLYITVPCSEADDTAARGGPGIVAVDVSDGSRSWAVETGGVANAPPSVAADTVYASTGNGVLNSIDAVTGERRWTYETEDATRASPSVGGDVVCLSTVASELHAIERDDGTERWRAEGIGQLAKPTIADEMVYAGGKQLLGVDLASGEIQWQFRPNRYTSTGFAVPAVVNDFLVVANCTKTSDDQPWYHNTVHVLR